jgi:hypothetical protein
LTEASDAYKSLDLRSVDDLLLPLRPPSYLSVMFLTRRSNGFDVHMKFCHLQEDDTTEARTTAPTALIESKITKQGYDDPSGVSAVYLVRIPGQNIWEASVWGPERESTMPSGKYRSGGSTMSTNGSAVRGVEVGSRGSAVQFSPAPTVITSAA